MRILFAELRLSRRVRSALKPSVLVFCLSLLVTSIFWMLLPDSYRRNESSDFLVFYEPVARNLLSGDGFVLDDGSPALAYPPGYSTILAAIFGLAGLFNAPEAGLLSLFLLACIALIAVIVFTLAREVSTETTGWIAAILWISYPPGLWLTKQPNSEIPFLLFLVAAAWSYWRVLHPRDHPAWLAALLTGALSGAAMLIRPIALGLPLVLGTLIIPLAKNTDLGSKLRLAFALIGTSILIVLPWQIAASQHAAETVLLSTSGAAGIKDGLTFGVNLKAYRVARSYPPEVMDLMNDFLSAIGLGQMDTLGEVLEQIRSAFIQRPGAFLQFLSIKAARSWYGTDSGRLETANLAIQVLYALAVFPAALRAWAAGGKARQFLLIATGITAYFWFMTVAALSIVRYMVPAMVFLLMLIPIGFAHGAGGERTGSTSP